MSTERESIGLKGGGGDKCIWQVTTTQTKGVGLHTYGKLDVLYISYELLLNFPRTNRRIHIKRDKCHLKRTQNAMYEILEEQKILPQSLESKENISKGSSGCELSSSLIQADLNNVKEDTCLSMIQWVKRVPGVNSRIHAKNS